MRLFQPTWSHPKRGGESHQSQRWAVEFRWRGRTCRLGLFNDKRASSEVARHIERLMELRQAGDMPDSELSRWLEQAPRRVIEYLGKQGIIDPKRLAATKTLDAHLNDWSTALSSKGSSDRHVELVVARARRLFTTCKFTLWSEIRPEKLSDQLAAWRKDEVASAGRPGTRGLSAQTSNFYLGGIRQFCRWMVRDGRATVSPVAHLDPLNVKVDRRHDRRAWQPDELRRLLDAAASGTERYGMTASDRALVYRVAAETGLRAGELRSLTRSSFRLDGDKPTVTIMAAYAKSRREDTLPLRPETAAVLLEAWKHKAPAAQVFNLPRRESVTRMLRADLTAARQRWLADAPDPPTREQWEGSDFLTYRDSAGRYLDFHSFRHAFITYLVEGGVHPKTAQRLARHGSIGLTLDRYTHMLGGNEEAALSVLPDFGARPGSTSAPKHRKTA